MTDPGRLDGSTAVSDVAATRVIKGRYRIIAASRVDREATVYAAEELPTGRPVTLEMLRDDVAADTDFVAAVRDYARRLARASCVHPAISRVSDCDVTDDGELFVAVEHVEGRSLRDVLDSRGPLDAAGALRVAAKIGEALETLHHNGIVHGELRPESVLLIHGDDGTDTVKLFGLELVAAHRTALGVRLRDPSLLPYLAPEQIEYGEVTAATDVHALGRLIRELVTPGPARGRGATARAMPPAVGRIVTRALDPRPERRYLDITLMINDLWSALGELETRTSRRHAVRSTVRTAVACVGGLALVVGVLWVARSQSVVAFVTSRVAAVMFMATRGEPSAPLPPRDETSAATSPSPSPAADATTPQPPTTQMSTPPASTSPVSGPPISTPAVSTPPHSAPPSSAPPLSTPAVAPPPVSAAARGATPAAVRPRPAPKTPTAGDPARRPTASATSAQTATARERATDAGDGSAIIDWLLKERRGSD